MDFIEIPDDGLLKETIQEILGHFRDGNITLGEAKVKLLSVLPKNQNRQPIFLKIINPEVQAQQARLN